MYDPEHVLEMLLHHYVTKAVEGNDSRPSTGVGQQDLPRHYFKIPYLVYFSGVAQRRMRKLINLSCNPIDIKFVYSTFKITHVFNVKGPLPDRLPTRIIYKFSCASCNACYVGETSRYFSTRVYELASSDRPSHVYKHLQASEYFRTSCNSDCFKILDSAPTRYQAELKESMYNNIKWEKPDLNQQVKHTNLTLSP